MEGGNLYEMLSKGAVLRTRKTCDAVTNRYGQSGCQSTRFGH